MAKLFECAVSVLSAISCEFLAALGVRLRFQGCTNAPHAPFSPHTPPPGLAALSPHRRPALALALQCGGHQQLRRALELMAEMRSRGIEANIHTYSALMSVCVKCK